MNRTEFCRKFAEINNITITQSNWFCEAVFDLLAKSILEEDRVYIKGLGTFKRKIGLPRRMGSLWEPGGIVEIPSKVRVSFTPSFDANEPEYNE